MWVRNKVSGVYNYLPPRMESSGFNQAEQGWLDILSISDELYEQAFNNAVTGGGRSTCAIDYVKREYIRLGIKIKRDSEIDLSEVMEVVDVKEEVQDDSILGMGNTKKEILDALKMAGVKVDYKTEKLNKTKLLELYNERAGKNDKTT